MTLWCRLTLYAPDGSALGAWTLREDHAPDLAAVDQLARLCLAARSFGGTVAISEVTAGLADLFDLAGLDELYGQMRREAERRERPNDGALERVEPADPAAGDLEDL
jgi:hypothetical protein